MGTTSSTKKRRAPALRKLDEETWGERLHRAYRRHRAEDGSTYREVAERVSALQPTSDAAIIMLEAQEDIPKQRRSRNLAYFTLLAYGYDPADFGLTDDNIEIDPQVRRRARELLVP